MPAPVQIAELADRGFVRVTGGDARKLLQGLVTNDLEVHGPTGATFAGLLTPQGKIMFDFFVVPAADGFLLEIDRNRAADLVKRLQMYKLRADVAVSDVSSDFRLLASWAEVGEAKIEDVGASNFVDPRELRLGTRIVVAARSERAPAVTTDAPAYDARRVALGVPEGGKDYEFGEAYPHEAGFDLFNGVSFTKGCYVGQEVVSRMQNKTVVRKRVVKLKGDAPLTSGADIMLGEAAIGRVGTVAGSEALGMLRLDRAFEAGQQGIALNAGGVTVRPDAGMLSRYGGEAKAAAAAKSQ